MSYLHPAMLCLYLAATGVHAQDAEIMQLLQDADDYNDACRGGGGDETETWMACGIRDYISFQLFQRGHCYGKQDQAGHEMEWHACEAGSIAAAKPDVARDEPEADHEELARHDDPGSIGGDCQIKIVNGIVKGLNLSPDGPEANVLSYVTYKETAEHSRWEIDESQGFEAVEDYLRFDPLLCNQYSGKCQGYGLVEDARAKIGGIREDGFVVIMATIELEDGEMLQSLFLTRPRYLSCRD